MFVSMDTLWIWIEIHNVRLRQANKVLKLHALLVTQVPNEETSPVLAHLQAVRLVSELQYTHLQIQIWEFLLPLCIGFERLSHRHFSQSTRCSRVIGPKDSDFAIVPFTKPTVHYSFFNQIAPYYLTEFANILVYPCKSARGESHKLNIGIHCVGD